MHRLNDDERELLKRLVDMERLVVPNPWESFVVVALGAANWVIVHPRSTPLPLRQLAHLDRLAECGMIMLEHMMSGARLFRLTPDGLAAVDPPPTEAL